MIGCGLLQGSQFSINTGFRKIVKLAGATDDIINAVNKTTNAMDDGITLSHIGYDTVVNGKDPTLSLFSFAFEKRSRTSGTTCKK